MSNITILSQPAQSQTYKFVPVYNGLPFVVSSTMSGRRNFKYTANISVEDVSVTTLKHNKNITYDDKGIFDIGRIVENFIVTNNQSFETFGFAGNTQAVKKYNVSFGVEYERYQNFTGVTDSAGYMGVQFVNTHDLRVGDRIVIQNSSNTSYNRDMQVTNILSTTSVKTNQPYDTDASGLCIEGEQFFDNYFYSHPTLGGVVGFAILNDGTRDTRINSGDIVVVEQDGIPTNPGYNGEWLVVDRFDTTISGTDYKIIVTNCPFGSSSPAESGTIYSKSKYNYTDLAISTDEYTWDGGLQYKDFPSYNSTEFTMLPTSAGRFLTNAPKNQKIQSNEITYLSIFNWFNDSLSTAEYIDDAIFKSYTSNGTLIDTFQHALGTSTSQWKRLDLGVGTTNMSGNLDLNGASYYTCELINTTGGTLSEVMTYTLDTNCYRHTQKRFLFKNTLGGWDTFTFNLRSDRTVTIDKSNYRKAMRSVNGSNVYGYSVGDRGRTTFGVTASDSETVFSNWLTNDEATWLEELYTSPDVYLIEDTNTLLPITVTNTDITIGEKENRGLISYSITYNYSYNKVIQRG